MSPSELQPFVKAAHITLAMVSGTLFTLRGGCKLLGESQLLPAATATASQVIDTALLVAALTLLYLLRLNPFTTPWLLTKLVLLGAYIGCGSLALRHARTRAGQAVAFAAALLCFVNIIGIARAQHPLGWLRGLAH